MEKMNENEKPMDGQEKIVIDISHIVMLLEYILFNTEMF
jgi:hypothetical protein